METLVIETVEIAAELLEGIQTQVEKQVIVHGVVKGFSTGECTVRLWPTTYLIPKGTNVKCKLLHHFNIVMYPQWQALARNATLHFTLIFEGLPADCTAFDLVEIIPEPNPFEVRNLSRNEQDVYVVYL